MLNPDGFLLLSFPDPYRREHTVDWGYAKEEQHGHCRLFGRNVEPMIAEAMVGSHLVPVVERDDVTGLVDQAYVVTGNAALLARLAGR